MKTKHLLFGWMLASLFLFSCKDKEATRSTEEQIEEKQPIGPDNTIIETNDSTTVVRDSVAY